MGEIFVAAGLLSEEQLAVALAEQQRSGRLLGELVVALGLASSAAVAAALAEQQGWQPSHGYGIGDLRQRLRAYAPPSAPRAIAAAKPTRPAGVIWPPRRRGRSGRRRPSLTTPRQQR